MKKVKLFVTEKLQYTREIIVAVPDEMTEPMLNVVLDEAQRGSGICIEDFVYLLKQDGIKLVEPYDDSLDSPDSMEIECEEYDFIDETKESA